MKPSSLFLLILIPASAFLALLRFDSPQLGTSYDDAHYIILAESLVSGEGYKLINFPRPQIERNFPPGFPILLAPFTLVFQKNFEALKLVSLVLWLASIPLVHKFFSKRLNSPGLEVLTAFVAFNPLLIGSSVSVMSESAYVFFSLLALVVFDKTDDKKVGWLILAAILAFYSQQIRTIGIALSASLLIYLASTRRFRDFGIASFILILGFSLQAWFNLRNGGSIISSGYEAQVLGGSAMEKISQVGSNVSGYFDQILAGSLIPIFGTRLDSIFPAIFFVLNLAILLTIAGGLFAAKPKLEWMHLYFAIYLIGILAFWNPKVGSVKARFLIPILPFFYFYFLTGLNWAAEKLNARFAERGLIIGACIISIILLARNILDWRNPIREQMTDISIGTSWIAEHAPADAIVMVNEPVPAYVHVKRRTINFPKNDQDLEKYLENQGVDYIVIAPLLQSPGSTELSKEVSQIDAEIQALPGRFELVFEDKGNNVRIFEYTSND